MIQARRRAIPSRCWPAVVRALPLIAALLPLPVFAAPPEVPGLALDAGGAIRWSFVGGASGYNVYRTTPSRVASGDYGDCVVGSHRTTAFADPMLPRAGEVLMFVATAHDETGEGTAGFKSDGGERFPTDPCAPARRYFAASVNGPAADGVLDGVEPPRNPSAWQYAIGGEATGVYLHSGEFFLTASDQSGHNGVDAYDWQGKDSLYVDSVATEPAAWADLTVETYHANAAVAIPAFMKNARKAKSAIAIPNLIEITKGGRETPAHQSWQTESFYVDESGILLVPPPDDGLYLGWAASAQGHRSEDRSIFDVIPPPAHGPFGWFKGVDWSDLVGAGAILVPGQWYTVTQSSPKSGDRFFFVDESGVIPKYPHLPSFGVPMPCGRPFPPCPDDKTFVLSDDVNRRTYRSQALYDGPLGHGWDLAANERLMASAGNVVHHDGRGRADLYTRTGSATFGPAPGVYGILIQNSDGSFTLRDPDGTLREFHRFDGTNREGAIERLTLPNGRFASFLYDHRGLLVTLVDPVGRSTDYGYDSAGRLTSVTDSSGRQARYGYDAAGNLTSVRSPIVTGTPNGNDFPSGKTTTYRYSSGFADGRLNHNLTEIVRPGEAASGTPAVRVTYGTAAGGFDLDRVAFQTIGGTHAGGIPSGGTLAFTYEALNAGFPPNPITPRRRATALDRNGNLKEFEHNAAGNLLMRTDRTNRELRPGEGDATTRFAYDDAGELTGIVYPEGNGVTLSWTAPPSNSGQRRHPIEIKLSAKAQGVPVRRWTFTWEPLFGLLLSATDARGNDSTYIPPNGGPHSPARYTTTWTWDFQEGSPTANGVAALAARFGIDLAGVPLNLGDRNGDGVVAAAQGNLVRLDRPTVRLDPASRQAAIEGDTEQEIVTRLEWNALGQAAAVTDPEGNRHTFEYYSEIDPEGDGILKPPPDDGRTLNPSTGGFLKTVRIDTVGGVGRNNGTNPVPVSIRHDFRYDAFGNLAAHVDGRGVLTRYLFNALGQVVEVRRAAATADASGPDGDPPTERGESGLAALGLKTRFAYDAGDNLVQMAVEDRGATRGVGPFVETTWTHDLLGNPLSVSREMAPGRTPLESYRYDANENVVLRTEPAGNAHSWAWDERDLLLSQTVGASGPFGGVPQTDFFEYGSNGMLTRWLAQFATNIVDYQSDDYGRIVGYIDQLGNRLETTLDPVSRPVRILRRGPVGGPPPPDRSGATNVDLADARLLYDEVGRLFRVDRRLFVPVGALPARTPILHEGDLITLDGMVNSGFEYDRISRVTHQLKDSGYVSRYDYDGAGRLVRATHPPGSETWQLTWDAAGGLAETVETEHSSGGPGGPPDEPFFTIEFRDALGRTTTVVDNAGQTTRYVFDSLGAVVASSDARGPAGGTVARRTPGSESITVPVNAHGNVTRYTYDAVGNRVATVHVLTPTGEGNGTIVPPPDDSNAFNADGLITTLEAWDDNSRLAIRTDDRGNTTEYSYDNADRRTTKTGDDGTVHRYTYDGRGNLATVADPKGSVVTYSYDLAHRLTRTSVAPGAGVSGTTEQTHEYDGLGRLTKATDANLPPPDDDVTLRFTYDSLSRLVEERSQSGAGAPLLPTDYGWLAEDLLTDLITPEGRRIVYGYDGADRMVLVDDASPTRPESASFEYFGLDRIHTRTNAAGLRATRLDDAGMVDTGFDAARRTTLLRHLGPTGTLLAGFEYRYDRQDKPASHRRLHHADAGGSNRMGEAHSYDSVGRLLAFREGFMDLNHLAVGPPDDNIDWTLDGTSNWNVMIRNGVTYLATPNNMNEYGEPKSGGMADDDGKPDDFHDDDSTPLADGLNLANDENGNLVFDGRHALEFDVFGRLVRAVRAADGAQVASYTYDALGRRARRIVTTGGEVDEAREYRYSFWFDGNAQVIEERNLDGTLAREVVYGPGGPLWQLLPGGTVHYVLEDAAGSTIALFSTAARGGIVERVTYDPHGAPRFESPVNAPVLDAVGKFAPQSSAANAQLFHGMTYEPELGDRADNANDDWGGLFTTGWQLYSSQNSLYVAQDSRWWSWPDSGSDWSYLPTRRMGLFLESSLNQGLGWAVFGPSGSANRPTEEVAFYYNKIAFNYAMTKDGKTRPDFPYDLGSRHDPNKGRRIDEGNCRPPCE